jgi:hypothetical protein
MQPKNKWWVSSKETGFGPYVKCPKMNPGFSVCVTAAVGFVDLRCWG